jgi:hypothetical protein
MGFAAMELIIRRGDVLIVEVPADNVITALVAVGGQSL